MQKEREKEARRLFPLEDRLKQHIVGQEGPIAIVSSGLYGFFLIKILIV